MKYGGDGFLKNIYMVQPNSQYGNSIYFPYAAGSLIAYAFKDLEIYEHYTFKDFVYKRSPINDIVDNMSDPFLVGFSCYVWNYEYNKTLAKAIKHRFPECYIVFGGHHINAESEVVGADYVDFCLLGEGEESFKKLLLALLDKEQFENINGLIYKVNNEVLHVKNEQTKIVERVSPYLNGYFDKLVEEEELEFSGIIETNRGCPNRCTFCDWGNIKSKVKLFDIDMIKAEIDWFSRNKIEYLFCADGNFGMFERDSEIADYIIHKRIETGYPQKAQVIYTKNNQEIVFEITKKFNDAGMSKGATLSFQSMSEKVLNIINRKNMPLESFQNIMSLYNSSGIAAYSEIIVGLPGESYESFKLGIEQLLEAGQHMAINFFNCELLPNSIMSSKDYMEKHGIEYAKTQQHQYHVVPTGVNDIPEYSKIIVATSTMSREDWININIMHVFVRTFHNLGLLQCIALYLYYEKKVKYMDFYCSLIDWAKHNKDTICGKLYYWLDGKYREILANSGSLTCYEPEFGELTWPLEEGSFLKVVKEFERFYDEIVEFLSGYFDNKELFDNIIQYQKMIVKTPYKSKVVLNLKYDFYDYFSGIYSRKNKALEEKEVSIMIDSSEVPQALEDFARETVWFGRKGGQLIISNITYI